jgi:hypothetical protein
MDIAGQFRLDGCRALIAGGTQDANWNESEISFVRNGALVGEVNACD